MGAITPACARIIPQSIPHRHETADTQLTFACDTPPPGAIIADDELRLLPREQAYSRVSGVTNLSSDVGSTGTFFITNTRLVWYSSAAEGFNISLPYLQVCGVETC